MKEFVFYMIIAWMELTGEAQKTIVLEFEHKTECESIMTQVKTQLEELGGQIRIKAGKCLRCVEIYEKHVCNRPHSPSPWMPKVTK